MSIDGITRDGECIILYDPNIGCLQRMVETEEIDIKDIKEKETMAIEMVQLFKRKKRTKDLYFRKY